MYILDIYIGIINNIHDGVTTARFNILCLWWLFFLSFFSVRLISNYKNFFGVAMFEMINLLGSASLGAVMQIVGAKANAQAEMMKQLTTNHKLEEISRDKVRNNTNSFFMMTRRIIVLSCIFAIIIVPTLAPLFTDTAIYIQTEVTTGSDWLIFDTRNTTMAWKEVQGIAILDWHKNIILSIVSMYVGSSIAKAK